MKAKFGLLALLVIGAVFASGCVNTTVGPSAMAVSCNWVYKTNGDYFDLIRANLGYDELGNEVIARIPGGLQKTMLSDGYIHEIDGCSKELGWVKPTNVAFLSKTVAEWNQETIECDEEMEAKREQLRLEKCGSLDFDFFVECSGEAPCAYSAPPEGVENPTNCTYFISQEEAMDLGSCKGHTYSIGMVIDRDPFSELYFCDTGFSIEDINNLIENNQLDTECEKLI